MTRRALWWTGAGLAVAVCTVRLGRSARAWDEHVREVASGPVDIAGLRAVVAEVVASRPPGAVEVDERVVPGQEPPGLPEHVRLVVAPRRSDAVTVAVEWWTHDSGDVHVHLGDDPPVELTAPVEINQGPERPFLDVFREILADVAAGRVDRIDSRYGRAVVPHSWGPDAYPVSAAPRSVRLPGWD